MNIVIPIEQNTASTASSLPGSIINIIIKIGIKNNVHPPSSSRFVWSLPVRFSIILCFWLKAIFENYASVVLKDRLFPSSLKSTSSSIQRSSILHNDFCLVQNTYSIIFIKLLINNIRSLSLGLITNRRVHILFERKACYILLHKYSNKFSFAYMPKSSYIN